METADFSDNSQPILAVQVKRLAKMRSNSGGKESGTMAADIGEIIAFYRSSYDLVSHYVLNGKSQPPIGIRQPRKCRFCLRSAPEVNFRKKAHAIPQLLGNNDLLSLDECSACNSRFGLLEDDLGKFTLPARALGRISGYNRVPSQKLSTGARVDIDRAGNMHASHDPHDPLIEVDEIKRKLRMNFELQPFRPLAVYKSFSKIVFSVLPSVETSALDACRQWLVSDGLIDSLPENAFFPYLLEIQSEYIAQQLSIWVFRRKTDAKTPYVTAVIRVGYCTYQVFLPAPIQDGDALQGENPFVPFPPPFARDQTKTRAKLTIHLLSIYSRPLRGLA